MSREVDRRIQRFDEVLDRLPGGFNRTAQTRRIQRTVTNAGRRMRRALIAGAMLVAGLLAYSLFIGGLGIVGFLLAAVLVPMCMLIAASAPLGDRDVAVAELKKTPPAQLPRRAEIFLDARRRDLPRLAAPTLDRISAQLNTLGPQLAAVPEMSATAQDVSRLLNTHLPELVERYAKVPPSMRGLPDSEGGPSIEARLVEGLKTVDAELQRASDNLAAEHRDAFLVQGKFLENRYNRSGWISAGAEPDAAATGFPGSSGSTTMAEKNFKAGDKVAWDSSGGHSVGKVVKKATSPTRIKGHKVAASKDNPEYIVKSDKGGEAAHKPGSLKKA